MLSELSYGPRKLDALEAARGPLGRAAACGGHLTTALLEGTDGVADKQLQTSVGSAKRSDGGHVGYRHTGLEHRLVIPTFRKQRDNEGTEIARARKAAEDSAEQYP